MAGLSSRSWLCDGDARSVAAMDDSKMNRIAAAAAFVLAGTLPALAACPYDVNCLNNPYGAGNPYAPNGLMNPYSRSGSPYSNQSWRNPYATEAPRLYDQNGAYRGRISANPYDPDSTSNPYGRYGSPYSGDSINNPYGAGNPLGGPIYVFPSR